MPFISLHIYNCFSTTSTRATVCTLLLSSLLFQLDATTELAGWRWMATRRREKNFNTGTHSLATDTVEADDVEGCKNHN